MTCRISSDHLLLENGPLTALGHRAIGFGYGLFGVGRTVLNSVADAPREPDVGLLRQDEQVPRPARHLVGHAHADRLQESTMDVSSERLRRCRVARREGDGHKAAVVKGPVAGWDVRRNCDGHR